MRVYVAPVRMFVCVHGADRGRMRKKAMSSVDHANDGRHSFRSLEKSHRKTNNKVDERRSQANGARAELAIYPHFHVNGKTFLGGARPSAIARLRGWCTGWKQRDTYVV